MELEICIDSVESARAAVAAGADRVELCSGLIEGGLTPSLGLIECVRDVLASSRVGLAVLIRPRGGDFVYSEDEMRVMLSDIAHCKAAGVRTVVLGCLLPDGSVDVIQTRRLVAAAAPMDVTFHRAIDVSRDPVEAVDAIVSVGGVARILSSGGEGTALEGAPVLAAMVERAADRIAIMAGGGIRPNNLERVVRQSGVRQVHMSCRSSRDGPMVFRKASVPMGSTFGPSEFTRAAADEGTMRRVIGMLR